MVGKVVSSSTQNEFSRDDEAAIASLGDASPQPVESVEEKEQDLPTAINCTSLTLVNVVKNESASLKGENQVSDDEVKDCPEGDDSAAPLATNEKCSQHVITPQTQEQAKQSQPTSLMAESSVSGEALQADREGQSSAAPITQNEKWSSEAITARSKARPWCMEKLKMAKQLRENPGVEFLMECWANAPALRIVIKKLVVKFPQ